MQNHVTLTGHLFKNVVLRKLKTGDGSIVDGTTFVLAVPRDYKNPKTGEEIVDFIDCVTCGAEAENLALLAKEGYLVSVEGRLQMETFHDYEGIYRLKSRIFANKVYTLAQKPKEEEPVPCQILDFDDLPF